MDLGDILKGLAENPEEQRRKKQIVDDLCTLKDASGSVLRTHIVHELGVQNASWIIPLLEKYEYLMD